jgi:hypothetical protein
MPDTTSSLNLPAAYLDMARAMFTTTHAYEGADRECPQLDELNHHAVFAMTAVSIVFSYQALEAWCNAQLHRIFTGKDKTPDRRLRLCRNMAPATNFAELKQKTCLADKIKLLCKACDIRTPHDADSQNWNLFKQVAETVRHFIIHPDPDSFAGDWSKMMEKNKAGTYAQVTQNIIRHFYNETNTPVPGWVEQSTYFQCRGFEILPPAEITKP